MKSIHVLLIEDSLFFAQLVKSLLREASIGDFELEHVENVAEGTARLATSGIDAILLDLTLPDSEGLDTFTRIHKVSAGVPIVIFTSLDDEELSLTTLEHGAADYLVKSEVNANWIARSLIYAVQRRRAVEKAEADKQQTARGRVILKLQQPSDRDEALIGHFVAKKLVNMTALELAKGQLFKMLERHGGKRLLLDFAEVEYISNAAISILLLVQKKSKSLGNGLTLCSVSPQVLEHFSSRRFDKIFDIRAESIEDLAGEKS